MIQNFFFLKQESEKICKKYLSISFLFIDRIRNSCDIYTLLNISKVMAIFSIIPCHLHISCQICKDKEPPRSVRALNTYISKGEHYSL